MADVIEKKQQIANDILSMHTPHMSPQLGANLGYGVNTFGVDMLHDINKSLQLWFKQNDARQLIGTIMASEAMGIITTDEADEIIQRIKSVEKKD